MKFSDEIINAYADGELQGAEKTEFEIVLEHDMELKQQIDDIQELKMQLRNTYSNVNTPVAVPVQRKVANYRVAAYSVFLFIAFTSGWIGSGLMDNPRIAAEQSREHSQNINDVTEKSGKYILHIGRRDDVKFKKTLDEAEALLASYQNSNQELQLEIIANAGGLDLFRTGETSYAERVQLLSERFPNIKFIACSNAIQRLKERGIEPNLINAAHTGATAIDQVVMRVNEGWTYVKI